MYYISNEKNQKNNLRRPAGCTPRPIQTKSDWLSANRPIRIKSNRFDVQNRLASWRCSPVCFGLKRRVGLCKLKFTRTPVLIPCYGGCRLPVGSWYRTVKGSRTHVAASNPARLSFHGPIHVLPLHPQSAPARAVEIRASPMVRATPDLPSATDRIGPVARVRSDYPESINKLNCLSQHKI
jgi:hypothetical protein